MTPWEYRAWKRRLYWTWRFSIFSKPWFWLKTIIHLHINARRTAVALDNCMRGFGQMNHDHKHPDVMQMPIKSKETLVREGYKCLPKWKWRHE